MKPEKALFVENLGDLKKQDLAGFSQLYFGHETCERRIPTLAEFAVAKKIAKENSLNFSLVTPFCTNTGLKKLLPLLKNLSSEDEIIVNDFGVLQLAAKKTKAKLVVGRLLNKQYRDPRIADFKNAPPAMLSHLRSSQASSELFQKLIKKFNIQRVELDNLLQGIEAIETTTSIETTNSAETTTTNAKLNASLYYPFVFIAATRFCLTANCDKLCHAKKIGIFSCGKECLRYSFRLENSQFKQPLFIFGNAIYFENKKIPKDLAGKGINRLVFTKKTLQ